MCVYIRERKHAITYSSYPSHKQHVESHWVARGTGTDEAKWIRQGFLQGERGTRKKIRAYAYLWCCSTRRVFFFISVLQRLIEWSRHLRSVSGKRDRRHVVWPCESGEIIPRKMISLWTRARVGERLSTYILIDLELIIFYRSRPAAHGEKHGARSNVTKMKT